MCAVQDSFKHWTAARRRIGYPIRECPVWRKATGGSGSKAPIGERQLSALCRHATLAVHAPKDDSLEHAERFFLLVEQGRGVEKFELDALDRPFDFRVCRDVADFRQHALSFRTD